MFVLFWFLIYAANEIYTYLINIKYKSKNIKTILKKKIKICSGVNTFFITE